MARGAERKRRVRLIQWGTTCVLVLALEAICRAGLVRPTTLVPSSLAAASANVSTASARK